MSDRPSPSPVPGAASPEKDAADAGALRVRGPGRSTKNRYPNGRMTRPPRSATLPDDYRAIPITIGSVNYG